MLGTIAAVLSLLQDFRRVKRPVRTNGWCEGMLCHCIFVLDLAVGWQAAGKQEDKPSCYQETKTVLR